MNLLKYLLISLFIAVLFFQCSGDKDLEKAVVISDHYFLEALINEGVDTNDDGIISVGEAEDVWYLYLAGEACLNCEGHCWNRLGIRSLSGIEAFKNLTKLVLSCTEVENLSLPKLPKLQDLSCTTNNMKSLDVSQCTALQRLNVFDNQLTELDVSKNEYLEYLMCSYNQLISIDLTNNKRLDFLDCSLNKLSLLDLTNNLVLTDLRCYGNQLETIDITQNPAIKNFSCGSNKLGSLNISNNSALTEIELSGMPTLYEVCVWELPFPPFEVDVSTSDSPNINFTMDCN